MTKCKSRNTFKRAYGSKYDGCEYMQVSSKARIRKLKESEMTQFQIAIQKVIDRRA